MKKKSSVKELLQKLGTLAALVILCIIFCIMMPDKFPKVANIMNILKQASINCLIASGMLCALITAGIDLSVGSNCALCTCFIGVLVEHFGIVNPVVLIFAGLAISTLCGFINGTLLTRLDLPHPFVSTMGMKNVLLGVALVITGSKSIAFTNKGVDGLMWIGGGSLFKTFDASGKMTFPGIPFSFILVIIVFCIFHVFLTKSALGRQIYCCGGNPEAARLSGINVFKSKFFVFAAVQLMSVLAAMMHSAQVASGSYSFGKGWETDVISSVVIGGTSMAGGIGKPWGTLMGVLFMGVVVNAMTILNVDIYAQYVVRGAIMFFAVLMATFQAKAKA